MPTTLEALAILVLFFVPGFVATQVYVRNDPTADASQPKYLLSVAVWSAIVHVAVFPATADVLVARDQILQHADVFVRGSCSICSSPLRYSVSRPGCWCERESLGGCCD